MIPFADVDVIGELVEGNLGRNVGGLKHMVITPATPDAGQGRHRGRDNHAYQREDSTLSNFSSRLMWQ